MFIERLEQSYYHALGIRKEFPELNPIAAGLLIAKSAIHIRKHHSIIEGYPLPMQGAAILTANHHREADTYKGVAIGRDVGRIIRPVLRKSLIYPNCEESAEFLLSIGDKQDKLNKYDPLRAFVLRGIGAIGLMRDNPGHDWIRTCKAALQANQLLSVFLQFTRHEDGCLRELQGGAALLMKMHPKIPVYPVALSGLPDGPDKATVLKPFTCAEKEAEYDRELNPVELTMIIADKIAEALPERVQLDWQTRRKEELNRLTSSRR